MCTLLTDDNMEVLPLHKHTHFTDACAELLNSHWPISKTARYHSLSKSCDGMPVCLALVKQDGSKVEVIGFSKMSAVQGVQNACLLESVIVKEMDRGKGLGRVLMKLTEDYAQKLGFKTVYLFTLNKEGFYGRLGYTKCNPVTSLGDNAQKVPEAMLKNLLGIPVSTKHSKQINNTSTTVSQSVDNGLETLRHTHDDDETSQLASNSNEMNNNHPVSTTTTSVSTSATSVSTAATSISTSTPPIPPPLPPCKQYSALSLSDNSIYDRTLIRMNPHLVTWMKKDL
uniref:N-acetyltransferase domain-containing protein n=1 Tax=Arion vulgaris TaxID=1028688 RepID=A0A0B7A526_9EUPU